MEERRERSLLRNCEVTRTMTSRYRVLDMEAEHWSAETAPIRKEVNDEVSPIDAESRK